MNWVTPDAPDVIHANWASSEIPSGFLRIAYDGVRATFFYKTTAAEPWTQMLLRSHAGQPDLDAQRKVKPLEVEMHWPGEGVPVFIEALPGGTAVEGVKLSFSAGPVGID